MNIKRKDNNSEIAQKGSIYKEKEFVTNEFNEFEPSEFKIVTTGRIAVERTQVNKLITECRIRPGEFKLS